jgi:hypothetical protein
MRQEGWTCVGALNLHYTRTQQPPAKGITTHRYEDHQEAL